MNIDIFTDFRVDCDFKDDFFAEVTELVLKEVNYHFDSVEVSVVITDDEDMRVINNSYRQIDRTTDVLSFPMNEGRDIQLTMLGDVVISIDTAIRQAGSADISLGREFTFLYIHGLLHLMGYDHEIGELEEKEMFDLQEKILSKAIVSGICK